MANIALDMIRGADEAAVMPENARAEIEDLRIASHGVARAAVSDAISEALELDGRSLRRICADTGLDPAFVSKLANGAKGATVASVALIALALGKSLSVTID